ncbi:hypothetical protein MBLNU457_5204t1 [Dothideomycetes sp. NU457]
MNLPASSAPLVYVEDRSLNGTTLKRSCVREETQIEEDFHFGSASGPQLLDSGDVLSISDAVNIQYCCRMANNPSEGLNEIQDFETDMLSPTYRVSERKLGFGAYGSVFAATEVSTKRQVACKIIDLCSVANIVNGEIRGLRQYEKDEVAYLEEYRKRMKGKTKRISQEYLLLAELSHPNIISVNKVFKTGNNIYIFQELMSGGDLFSYLDSSNDGHLPEVNAAVIVRQVLEAVRYLHKNGIAHRDIKPENVLMTNLRPISRVVLTDFGHARKIPVDEEGSPIKRRMQTTCVGTHDYAAPEIYGRDKRNPEQGYTEAVDLWSVGVITALLLTSDTLFVAPNGGHQHMTSEDERNRYAERQRSDFITQLASQCRLTVTNDATNPHWRRLSSRAKSFIMQLLVPDEHQRLKAKEALDHSWFTHPTYAAELQCAYDLAIRGWKQSSEHTDPCTEIDTLDITGRCIMQTPPPDSVSQQGTRSKHFPPQTGALSEESDRTGVCQHFVQRRQRATMEVDRIC